MFATAEVLLFFCAVTAASGHGAMRDPRPRNNDPRATAVVHPQQTVMWTANGSGLFGWAFPHDHSGTCSGPRSSFPVNETACAPLNHTYGLRIQRRRPVGVEDVLIDCTPHNDCSYQSQPGHKSNATEFVYEILYPALDCSGRPSTAFKMNIGPCTSFGSVRLEPTTAGCEGLSCLWFSQGCGIGCPECTLDNLDFFTSPCNSTKQPTVNDPQFRTFNRLGEDPEGDWTASHPWRAPGSAPVLDACGMAGGSTKNNDNAAGYAPSGHKMGDRGSQLPPAAAARWTAGAIVEVSWAIWANHGGGYQYRLCSKQEALTEECFQRMPLPFAGSKQTLRLGNGEELEVDATLVSKGTVPEGSTWAMNPVPACASWTGSDCGKGPQFPPPPGCDLENCWGYLGPGAGNTTKHEHVLPTIVDKLKLPDTIAPGEYVLGWRWDSEQTPQIWASCADVEITKELVVV